MCAAELASVRRGSPRGTGDPRPAHGQLWAAPGSSVQHVGPGGPSGRPSPVGQVAVAAPKAAEVRCSRGRLPPAEGQTILSWRGSSAPPWLLRVPVRRNRLRSRLRGPLRRRLRSFPRVCRLCPSGLFWGVFPSRSRAGALIQAHTQEDRGHFFLCPLTGEERLPCVFLTRQHRLHQLDCWIAHVLSVSPSPARRAGSPPSAWPSGDLAS